MEMKKSILILCGLFCAITFAQAQSLGDFLKSLSGNTLQQNAEVKPKHPSARELADKWSYQELAMEYTGGDALASLAISSAKEQLATLNAKLGLTPGKDNIQIKSNGSMTINIGDNKISGRYSYIPPTGGVIITLGEEGHKIILTATATLRGEALYIMFNAKELIAVVEAATPQIGEDQIFMVAKTLINAYDGIMIGAKFN